jgi:hypothetical protein
MIAVAKFNEFDFDANAATSLRASLQGETSVGLHFFGFAL